MNIPVARVVMPGSLWPDIRRVIEEVPNMTPEQALGLALILLAGQREEA
jgi:hypothetical protein